MSLLEWGSSLFALGPFGLALVAIVAFSVYMLAASLRQPGGGPLGDAYPPVEPLAGTRRTLERVVFGAGPRMTWVKVGADAAHLHVRSVYSLGTRSRFSVPLEEITAVHDRFPLMLLSPDVVRLTFARDPGRPMLVWRRLFERLSEASEGRLKVTGAGGRPAPPPPPPPPPAAGKQGGGNGARVARAVGTVVLALSLGAAECGDRAEGASAERTPVAAADDDGLPAEPAPPAVDPCGLLTEEEISEQLWLAIPTHQREHYKTRGFDVTRTEVPWGISRRCEVHFGTRETVSGGPVWRGDFNVMVSHAASYVADRKKTPVPGVGDEAYRHQQVWYVRVGDLIASLTDFDGTSEPGLEPDAGRIALLRQMAQRLR